MLDKDILSFGKDKRYSPDTCAFVTKTVNSFILDFGVSVAKHVRKRTKNCFEARISDPLQKKELTFYSDNYEDCRDFAIKEKLRIVNYLANKELDCRIKVRLPEIYEEKYKCQKTIL